MTGLAEQLHPSLTDEERDLTRLCSAEMDLTQQSSEMEPKKVIVSVGHWSTQNQALAPSGPSIPVGEAFFSQGWRPRSLGSQTPLLSDTAGQAPPPKHMPSCAVEHEVRLFREVPFRGFTHLARPLGRSYRAAGSRSVPVLNALPSQKFLLNI